MYTFELNNERKDANFASGRVSTKSPVVEIFSAMRDGKDLARFGKKADQAANYIKELNSKASAGDLSAVSELNEIRRFAMEPVLMKNMIIKYLISISPTLQVTTFLKMIMWVVDQAWIILQMRIQYNHKVTEEIIFRVPVTKHKT